MKNAQRKLRQFLSLDDYMGNGSTAHCVTCIWKSSPSRPRQVCAADVIGGGICGGNMRPCRMPSGDGAQHMYLHLKGKQINHKVAPDGAPLAKKTADDAGSWRGSEAEAAPNVLKEIFHTRAANGGDGYRCYW